MRAEKVGPSDSGNGRNEHGLLGLMELGAVSIHERRAIVAFRRVRRRRDNRELLLRCCDGGGVHLVVFLLAVVLEVRGRREEHRAGDEGGDAAQHEHGPGDEDEDGPGGAEAMVEAALEDVAELDGKEGKGAVREDNAPPGDAELGQLLHAAEDGEEGEHDPGDAHAPKDVCTAEADGEDHLACERDLGEVVSHGVGNQLGQVGAIDEEGEATLAEGRERVEGGKGDETLGRAVQEETHEEAERDHSREGQSNDTHRNGKGGGNQRESGEFRVKRSGNETTTG